MPHKPQSGEVREPSRRGLLSRFVAAARGLPQAAQARSVSPLAEAATGSRLPRRHGLVLGLLLLALASRAAMSARMDVICPDGPLYIRLAQAWERGDVSAAMQELNLNIYPLILVALHQLGFDWEQGGELLGLVAAGLVVCPLFGWARRQWNDTVAALACGFYAVHPKLILWSPELYRDPTYWLVFTLALYWMWRAIVEVRWRYYLLAGAAFTFASLTRIEGLFLAAPLALWTGSRWLALPDRRRTLLAGALVTAFALPLLILVVNLAWIRGRSEWQTVRMMPLKAVQSWAVSLADRFDGQPEAESTPREGVIPPRRLLPPEEMPYVFLRTMGKGISPHFGLFLAIGIWRARRAALRNDHRPMLLVTALTMGGIWIHLWFGNVTSTRYVMSIVIVAAPAAALGVLTLLDWVDRFLAWCERAMAPPVSHRDAIFATVASSLCIGLAIGGWIDALPLSSSYHRREAWAQIGRWIDREYGPGARIAGSEEMMSLIGYYSRGEYHAVPPDVSIEQALAAIDERRAQVLLIPDDPRAMPDSIALVDRASTLGFHRVDALPDPVRTAECTIFVRSSRR